MIEGTVYTGDMDFAIGGYNVYLVPTNSNELKEMLKIKHSDFLHKSFDNTTEAKIYANDVQETIKIE